MFCAPGGELTQVERVRLSGQTRVAGQEADQCQTLGAGDERVVVLDGGGDVLELDGGASFDRKPQLSPQPHETPATSVQSKARPLQSGHSVRAFDALPVNGNRAPKCRSGETGPLLERVIWSARSGAPQTGTSVTLPAGLAMASPPTAFKS